MKARKVETERKGGNEEDEILKKYERRKTDKNFISLYYHFVFSCRWVSISFCSSSCLALVSYFVEKETGLAWLEKYILNCSKNIKYWPWNTFLETCWKPTINRPWLFLSFYSLCFIHFYGSISTICPNLIALNTCWYKRCLPMSATLSCCGVN